MKRNKIWDDIFLKPIHTEPIYTLLKSKEFRNILKQIKRYLAYKITKYQILPPLNGLDKHDEKMLQKLQLVKGEPPVQWWKFFLYLHNGLEFLN